jgi:4-amino-4-deoxy-L-arabinose transferase-like glycosyltransferase
MSTISHNSMPSTTMQSCEVSNALSTGFFEKNRGVLWLIMSILFIVAFGVRVYFFDASRAVGEVQYRSAVIARAFYFEWVDTVPEWRKDVNSILLNSYEEREPPITEYLVSIFYWIAGGEYLWIARLINTFFWLIGGTILFLIARHITTTDAAVFATAYYLFVPIGIFLSTSFQTDSLMMMMYLVSIFAMINYTRRSSLNRLVLTAFVSGLSILVRPLIIFAIFTSFLFIVLTQLVGSINKKIDERSIHNGEIRSPIYQHHWYSYFKNALKPYEPWRKTIIDLFIFSTIVMVIGVLYYVFGIFVAGKGLETQASVSFVPRFLMEREYWRGWLLTATGAVGFMPLVLSIFGIPLLRPGIPRALVSGLWFGYLFFCLVFTFHIHFNQYYHAQLFPIVALSLGGVSAILFKQLRRSVRHWYWWAPVIVSILMIALFTARDVRALFNNQAPIESQQTAWEIGELVNHSTNTILIASYYGRPLMYMAEISGTYWPRRITSDQLIRDPGSQEQSTQERIDSLGFDPEYFIITNFPEYYSHHDDLRDYLLSHCKPLVESDQYLIYHECASSDSSS